MALQRMGNILIMVDDLEAAKAFFDEYRFLVQPFIMGRGRQFFADGTPPTKLLNVAKIIR